MSNRRTLQALFYTADFGGVGHLRGIFPNDLLNSRFNNTHEYSGIASDKFFGDGRLLGAIDILRLQRQITDNQLTYIKQLRQLRDANQIKLGMIYDLDDNILEIPDYNCSRPFYPEDMCRRNLSQIFDLVDMFTSATPYLSARLQTLLKGSRIVRTKFQVVPNLLPKFLYYMNPEYKKENVKPKVLWAGSATHFNMQTGALGDLSLIYDLVLNTRDEFDWVFMGGLPEAFKKIDNITQYGWYDSYDYPRALKEVNADFGISPLLDNEFNKCKSNIKYLEYSAIQAIHIASDLEPYKKDVKFFLQPTWQETRDMIHGLFADKQKKQEIINEQNESMKKYWLEDNLDIYTRLFGMGNKL